MNTLREFYNTAEAICKKTGKQYTLTVRAGIANGQTQYEAICGVWESISNINCKYISGNSPEAVLEQISRYAFPPQFEPQENIDITENKNAQ